MEIVFQLFETFIEDRKSVEGEIQRCQLQKEHEKKGKGI
jgi:hypothetical protein